jgi:YD repeat-containing protein
MPTYWVSEPYINLRLEDEPLGYNPARGNRISFHLSYRQRGAIHEDPAIFSVGPNWSCSFRAFLIDMGGGFLRLHRGGAGFIEYTNGVPFYRDGSLLGSVSGGYQIQYRNGATNFFTKSFINTNGLTCYFLTEQADPAGNLTTYSYAAGSGVQLAVIYDPDNNPTQLYYDNVDPAFTNLITRVVDPFQRTNYLTYDENGYLTNVVDVQALTNSFAYDAVNAGGSRA